jgi:hypothetical protein
VHYVADWQEAAEYTAAVAREGDYVITLGCGNVPDHPAGARGAVDADGGGIVHAAADAAPGAGSGGARP